MIITISDMWKNQQKMLDNDNQIKLSSLIGFLAAAIGLVQRFDDGNSVRVLLRDSDGPWLADH